MTNKISMVFARSAVKSAADARDNMPRFEMMYPYRGSVIATTKNKPE
jgi:hypothetical protein